MLVTLDTSHLERSPLNDDTEVNMPCISVTAETSQDAIGPSGPLEQSVGDSLMHFAMAALSSSLEKGENAVVISLHASHDWG